MLDPNLMAQHPVVLFRQRKIDGDVGEQQLGIQETEDVEDNDIDPHRHRLFLGLAGEPFQAPDDAGGMIHPFDDRYQIFLDHRRVLYGIVHGFHAVPGEQQHRVERLGQFVANAGGHFA